MNNAKIYGLCLERLRHQIANAQHRRNGNGAGRVLLESYQTADVDDIVDILELYDMEGRRAKELRDKLEDLAYTASLLVRERVMFDYTDDGHLGLYWVVHTESGIVHKHQAMV